MPFGFGKNGDNHDVAATIEPLDNDNLQEIEKIHEMLNPNEALLIVVRQSRVIRDGQAVTPNISYATNKRIIIRDPYMLGIKENVVDIPYHVLKSVKLEKGLFSSTIRYEAPVLVGSKRLGMIDVIVCGETDNAGFIEAIPTERPKTYFK